MFSAARTVVTFGIVFQVAGLGKLLIIARYFGAGPVLDAYYLGLVIPTFLVGLSASLLHIGFVPQYIEARARQDNTAAERIRNDALTYTALALGLAAAIIGVAEKPIMALFWPDIDPAMRANLFVAFGMLMWTAPINGFIGGVGLLLNAEGRFVAAAGAPLINLILSAVVIVLWPDKSLGVLMWSLFIGLLAQVLLLDFALRRAGIRFIPRITSNPVSAPVLLSIGFPVLLASIPGNLIPAFMQVIAARAGPGAVSAFGYASRLQTSLVQAIVMSVSMILLPHFSRLLTEGKQDELRKSLNRVLAATTVFYFAALTFVATAGPMTVELLLQRGRFTAADGRLVSEVWLALTAGLLGATWGIFLVRLFQAKKLPWVITTLGFLSVGLNVALSLVLIGRLGIVGVALANALAYTVVMILLHVLASRTVERFIDRTTVGFVAVALLVNLAAGLGAVFWGNALTRQSHILIVFGQAAIILLCNLLVLRRRPLSLSPKAVLGF